MVGFDEGVDEAALSNLAGVINVNKLTNNRYQLTFKDTPTASTISQLSADKGWKLNELTLQNESLEQIFMNLIHNEVLPEGEG